MDAGSRGTSSILYSQGVGQHYFACRLRHISTLAALGVSPEHYAAERPRRQTEFLTCLLNPGNDRLTYDLRLISQPDPSAPARGRLTIALLCRMDGVAAEEAHRYASHLLHLLEACFDEYAFELAGAEEVQALLRPFALRYLVAITRRAGLERLDTLKGEQRLKRLGFTRVASPPESGLSPSTLFHLFPYLPTQAPFTNLFKLLLLEPAPVAISCRLQPTLLASAEAAFLEEQIARCERAAQAELRDLPQDLASLQPTLKEQAKLYQQYQARLLFGLKDNAALMTLEVASLNPIPVPVVDVLGALVTEPAGGIPPPADGALHRYLAGGYEVADHSDDPQSRDAFQRMALVLTPHPLAPRGAARLLSLFDAMEATAACRLPPATVEVPAGLTVQFWRTQAAPRELPEEGCLIGMSVHRGMSQAVRIGRDDRRRHVYLMGQTGTGKTTLLQTMILDDMRAGAGLCVIDPHGDLFRELLGQVPAERIEDVVILDPTDIEHPVGLNMLEYNTEAQRHFLIQELVGIIFRLMQDEYGEQAATMTGPIFFQHMRMNLLLAMSNPANPGTLLEFYTIYQEKDYWRRWLPLKTADPLLERWVKESLPSLDYTKPASEGTSMGGYIGSKFEGFVFDPMLRNIFGQKRSTLNLREIMDTGKVLLVNLAKGELTETNSRFLGMMLLAKLQAAAMGRVKLPRHERRDFSLYVDEFQSLATQHFVTLLSEARKFGLNLVLANQFVSQIKDPRIVQALFGNVGTLIAFRLGQMDAELVERELSPVFTRFDLVNLPNWRAYMTTLINGQTVQPFSLQTLFDPTPIDAQRAATVQKRSRQAYGRLRRQAEAEIAKSFQGDTKS